MNVNKNKIKLSWGVVKVLLCSTHNKAFGFCARNSAKQRKNSSIHCTKCGVHLFQSNYIHSVVHSSTLKVIRFYLRIGNTSKQIAAPMHIRQRLYVMPRVFTMPCVRHKYPFHSLYVYEINEEYLDKSKVLWALSGGGMALFFFLF